MSSGVDSPESVLYRGGVSRDRQAGSPELSSSAGEGVRAKNKNYAVEARYVQTMCGRYHICALEHNWGHVMWGLGSESQKSSGVQGGIWPLPKTKLRTVSFVNKLREAEQLDVVDPVEVGNAMYEVVGVFH